MRINYDHTVTYPTEDLDLKIKASVHMTRLPKDVDATFAWD